jgi:hypothetical protein
VVTRRGGVKRAIDSCRELARAGIQHLILSVPDVHEIEPLEVIGREVIPAVAEL